MTSTTEIAPIFARDAWTAYSMVADKGVERAFYLSQKCSIRNFLRNLATGTAYHLRVNSPAINAPAQFIIEAAGLTGDEEVGLSVPGHQTDDLYSRTLAAARLAHEIWKSNKQGEPHPLLRCDMKRTFAHYGGDAA